MTRNEIRRVKKGIDLIDLLLKELASTKDVGTVLKRRDSFYHIFYNGDRMDELFLFLFPVEELEYISKVFSAIKTANGTMNDELSSTRGIYIRYKDLVQSLNDINLHLKKVIKNNNFKIFYSWQSDLENTTNRSFIQAALEKSISSIKKDTIFPLELDKDTIDRAGSPDIANTILRKIDDCFIFVADVSLTLIDNKSGKKSPNSNVLFELGYAQGILSEENIIMVYNTAYGNIEDLPFDLRGRRIMQYYCSKDSGQEEKKIIKDNLLNQLQSAIRLRCKIEIG